MRIATDIGGTFTDLVYLDHQGNVQVEKSNTTPLHFEKGVLDVIEKAEIDLKQINTFIHGTTIIINALTERRGVKTGLITTKGFRDVLEIARGNRPDLFNIRYQQPTPFIDRYLRQEVEERVNYKGEVLEPINKEELKHIIEYFKAEKLEAIAISFLHSYVNPIHEKEALKLVKELWPEVDVTASHEITNEWREYERTNTTALNAYVKPIAVNYIDKLDQKLNVQDKQKFIMQSNGGITTFEDAKHTPINLVESGPVAGIFGSAVLGELIGEENIIAFDVGGTTAKCSLIESGEVKVETDYAIERSDRSAGYPIKVPVVDIVEIGNGGGSIAWLDDAGSLKVGPKSAGALPGPIAYGLGGKEPTTTDANLLTGRLSPKNFDFQVNIEEVEKIIDEKIAKKFNISPEEAALGIIRIANSNMLNALKLISTRKGYNPQNFTMVAFGGGGSMHATALAKALGVRKVVIPIASPVFSAWGMLMTDLRHDYINTFIRRIHGINKDELMNNWKQLETNAISQFKNEGIDRDKVEFQRFLDMRYLGQEHTVKVPVPNGHWTDKELDDIVGKFHELHEQNYTFRLEDIETEIVNLHLIAFGKVKKPKISKISRGDSIESALLEERDVYFEDGVGWVKTKVYDRELLPVEQYIEGPSIVEEKSAVTVIYKGQKLKVDCYGNLIIEMEEK